MKSLFFLILFVFFPSMLFQSHETKPLEPVNAIFSQGMPSNDVLDSNDPPTKESLSIYNFSLVFDQTGKKVTGTLKFTFSNSRDVPFSQLYFHLWPEAPLLDKNASLTIQSITDENGTSLSHEILNNTNLIVNLPEPVELGEFFYVLIEFRTSLAYAPDRFGWYDEPFIIYNFGNWYPQLSVYENGAWDTSPYVYGGEAFYSETAIYEVTLVAPDALIAAASGEVIHNESLGGSAWRRTWKTGPVRDFFFSLSPDLQVATKIFQNTTIISYFHPDQAQAGKLVLDIVEEDLTIFGNLFGPYPYSTLSVVETPAWFGGMEYPNIVLIVKGLYSQANEDSLRDVVSHEVAHNWFAYLIGSDSYAEPWLDEAFATYCGSYLYFEFTGRPSLATANLRFYQQAVIDTVKLGFDYKINQSMVWWDSPAYNSPIDPKYGAFIYLKGMAILHMLRQVVGNETFFESIQAYFGEWAYENAHIRDFIVIVEETAGYDLDWFFDEWLDDTGVPEYNLIWSQAIIYPNRTILNMTIRQNQEKPFIMPIDISVSIENRTNPYKTIIWINESVQVVTIEIPGEIIPTMVELDPQGWVLRSAGNFSSVVTMHTDPRSTSAEASAFDLGVLFFLLMVVFPTLLRFQRKKSP